MQACPGAAPPSPVDECLPRCSPPWPHFWLCRKPGVQLVQQQCLLFRSEQACTHTVTEVLISHCAKGVLFLGSWLPQSDTSKAAAC